MLLKTIKSFTCTIFSIGLSFGLVSTLTSCSVIVPTFNTTNVEQDWVAGQRVDLTAIWSGYYFDDIPNPSEYHNIKIPEEHKNDIELVSSNLYKDNINHTEFANVTFRILQPPPQHDAKPFNVVVTWTIKHTNFKKDSILTISPPDDNVIKINQDFLYVSQPDTDYDLNESELSALPDNSIQCIDGVYNTNYPDFFRDELKSRSAIETHLVNDICWYQYLMWNALNCLYINPSLPNIYVNLNKSSWKFHIDLEYNYAEQIFTYLKVHLEATATMHISILPTTTGKIDLDYTWGNPVQSASGELTTGPKLLGGYTVSNVAGREHFPQGYNEDGTSSFNPYTQNFISLVPSELGSYQTFNLNVNSSIMNMTSHPRLYFMSQPRFFGLEYATGEEHLGFSTNASSYGYDSFSNWQFAPPSYTLSGMSFNYTTNQYIHIPNYTPKQIKQCYVNINCSTKNQPFFNYISPGDKTTWANNFIHPALDKDMGSKPDPDFIKKRYNEYELSYQSLGTYENAHWKNLKVKAKKEDTSILLDGVKYFQIIQQQSGNVNYSDPTGDRKPANILGGTSDNKNLISVVNDKFTLFSAGLNYLFYTDNMYSDEQADNVFYYTQDSLNWLNNNFQNNPT